MDSMSGMMGLPERGYDGRGRFRLLAQGLVPPTLGAELLCGADVLGIAACGLGSLAVSGGGALVPEHALLAGGEVLGGAVLGGLLLRWMRPAAADPVRALASAALGGLVLMALLGVVGLLDGAVHGMGGGHVVLWSAPPMTDWVACWAVLATGLVVLGRTGAVLWSAVLPRPELADASPIPPAGALAKAFTDRLLAGTALLLLSPLLLAVAIAVRLDSPGPAIFRQEREGLHGRRFTVLKFRSMRVAAAGEALRQTERGDARCSALGAFLRRSSLDELPQLINVLRGDMSLVGPRPHALAMRTEGRPCHELVADYALRHQVRPGLTGWAQVNGARGATSTADELRRRVELDLHYVGNWSFFLDLRIMVLTAVRLLRDEGAF